VKLNIWNERGPEGKSKGPLLVMLGIELCRR
jgi:hypothetical protein